MGDFSSLTLRNLINENLLVTAEKRMCNLLGLQVATIDSDGNMFGEMVNASSFSKLICSSSNGAALYRKSNLMLFQKVLKDSTCRICDCIMGFKSCVAPIVVEEVIIGFIMIGYFYPEGEEYKKNQYNIKKLSKELGLPETDIQAAISKLPVVSDKVLMNCIECCELLSSYFTEIAMNSIAEKKLVYQTEEKLRLEDKAEKAQLKILGAQINPHFLFNTLNSITRMALLEDSPHTEEMTYCLSDLLRYSIKQNEEFPTLDSELQNIKKYLFIQSIRYMDRIKYFIDVPEELLNFRIPAMILQPIVENAIIHGLEPKIDGGNIYITGEIKGGDLKILVKDTGVGIPSKRISKLLCSEAKPEMGLGIYSSHHRLNVYFGYGYGLNINSNENIETTIEINLPCFKEISPSHKS